MHDERTCVVPENIHTTSSEAEGGGSQAVISEG